ncbi:hypothetical protein [Nocardia gipuzkoensis]
MDEVKPRRSKVAENLYLLDYPGVRYVEAVTADGETLATVSHFSPAWNSATFTGWVVEESAHSYSDPIPNKREALDELKAWAFRMLEKGTDPA